VSPSDEVREVEEANARFYRAFENMDLQEMEAVWAHGDYVKCIHPGWGLLVGSDAVRASWEAIFKNTEEMRFTITNVDVRVNGDLAWVACTENILSQVKDKLSVTSVLATNLFERSGNRWLLAHHHASHVFPGEAEPSADAT
jgi:ketosteroid isomerase-like protein